MQTNLIRRKHNRINDLKINSDWVTDERSITEAFLENFKNLFESSSPSLPEEASALGEKVISDTENALLIKVPDLEEIKQAVWTLHPLKSPRPNGYPGIFFRTYWKTVHERVGGFV